MTLPQLKKLEKRRIKGGYKGRLKGARRQLEKRLARTKRLRKEGSKLINKLSKRDLLLIGTGLYWGEGTKNNRARITNSDPEIIKFMLKWFESVWGVSKDRFSCQVLINEIHRRRVSEVENYWSTLTGIPKSQFTKTTLIKTKNKKKYDNFRIHFGTLVVTVRRGTNLRHKIEGVISKIHRS